MIASASLEQRLEHAAVGVETGGEQDRVVLAEMRGDRQLELAMQVCAPQMKRTEAMPKPNSSSAASRRGDRPRG